MDRGATEDVPVLIVGGSLVGLSAALSLRWHGVDVLAVERHAGTAINARAGHFHLRTVEILRSAGLEDAVRHKSHEQYPPDGVINNVESLAGREIADYFPNLNAGVDEFSPTVRLFINQDALEPILRYRASELGARLRYRTECTSLEQDADGVTAVVRDLENGTESSVRAKYVVAADGNRSPVRERLGIGMHRHGLLSHSITIYFRALADLGPLLKDRNQGVHYVTNPMVDDFSMETGYRYDSPAVVLEPAARRCTSTPGSPQADPEPGHRTSSSTATARGCRHWTCSAGTSSCWPDPRARPGQPLRWPRPAGSGWASTRTWWGEPGWPTPRAASRGVRDLAVRSRTGATGRLRGLAGPRSGRHTRTGSPAGAQDAAVPRRRPAMNSESGRRKKVHSWHTCIARTPWDRSCARST
jgi:hypothetical protein